MAEVGLQEAAQLTGKNASTITRAAKEGRLSFSTDEVGKRVFDTSELHRVFKIIPPQEEGASVRTHDDASPRTSTHDAFVSVVNDRERALLEDKIRLLQDQVDRERKFNDDLSQQNRQLLMMLTDQRPAAERKEEATVEKGDEVSQKAEGAMVAAPVPPQQRSWWQKLLGA